MFLFNFYSDILFRLSGEFGISFLLEVLSVLRVLRWSWQSTVSVLLEISAYQIIAFILDRSNFIPGEGWESSNLQLLMLISLCRDRLGQKTNKIILSLQRFLEFNLIALSQYFLNHPVTNHCIVSFFKTPFFSQDKFWINCFSSWFSQQHLWKIELQGNLTESIYIKQ